MARRVASGPLFWFARGVLCLAAVSLSGHFWTIAPNLLGRVVKPALDDQPLALALPDGHTIAGALGRPRGATRLGVVVHGLGGEADSPYMLDIAAALQARGWASLRVSMRGAGRSSPDFYHAGLWQDLAALLESPALLEFDSIVVIGCSLGGHIALHLGCELDDPRLRAVVAIGSPLDLAPNVDWLDAPHLVVYRRHILGGLERIYHKIHGRPRRFPGIREWDAEVVVPRWGFESVEQYWQSQAIATRLASLRVPALYVGALGDPMVPAHVQQPFLARARNHVDFHWLRGAGHVGFPPGVDLGQPGELGIWPQVLRWCERTC